MTQNDFWYNIGVFHEYSDGACCKDCVVMDYKLEYKDYKELCKQGCCEAIKDVYKRVVMEEEMVDGKTR